MKRIFGCLSLALLMFVSYSCQKEDVTDEKEKESKKVVSFEYVDLGLSVKWATFNVGATAPEEIGDYFAWGEAETKSNYTPSTYKFLDSSSSSLIKYNYNTDEKTTLEPGDDVVHIKWGGEWRMPTEAEFTELKNNCSWEWTTQNGVKGYKVTSNKSGYTNHSIFLPAAGYYDDSTIRNNGSNGYYFGYYWSSSLNDEVSRNAWCLFFNTVNMPFNYGSYPYARYFGLTVRPVCP